MKLLTINITLLLGLILTFLTSCEKVVNIEIPEIDQKPVLFSLIGDSHRIKAYVSNTYDILTYVTEDEYTRQDSTVFIKLFVNNQYKETLTYTPNYYISDYRASAGDSITLLMIANSKDTLSAKTYVPYPTLLDSVSLTALSYYDNENILNSTATLYFKDTPGETNYYEIFFQVSCITDSGKFNPVSQYNSNNVILLNEDILNYNPQSIIFSDQLFNGDKVSISISFPFPCINDTTGEYINKPYVLKIYFSTISEAYYQYRKDLYKYLYSKYGGIFDNNIEPKNIYSNIKGGYGLVAGFSSKCYTIKSVN